MKVPISKKYLDKLEKFGVTGFWNRTVAIVGEEVVWGQKESLTALCANVRNLEFIL